MYSKLIFKHDKLRPSRCRLTAPTRGIRANIRIYLIFPEMRVISLHFAADNMCLCLLLFTQLSFKVEPSKSKTADTQTEFDVK